MTIIIRCLLLAAASVAITTAALAQEDPWVVYEGGGGAGSGKHIVFVTGDEEYRSEEAMPMLARILAERHGFRCTVLFAIDPETGEIDPENITNIPGLHHLDDADLMVLFIRWRSLPDEQMRRIIDYTHSGRPIIGLRTSTHPFNFKGETRFDRYGWRSANPDGGYGRAVFGETWVRHHGDHGTESTRGLVEGLHKDHPILNGVRDVWGPTDVYEIRDLPSDASVLLHGQVLRGMEPDSPPNYDKSLMPIAWTRSYAGETGNTSRIFFTTMGASADFESEDLRRLLVNAAYWSLGLEDQIPARADVNYVGDYSPTPFGFGTHRRGVKPADLAR